MSIIRERIKFNNLDTNIKFGLGIGNRLSGYQQEIDSLTEETKVELTNPIIDNEVRRFQYDSNDAGVTYLWFYFSAGGSSAYNSFTTTGARFQTNEINNTNSGIQNSFFIMDFYDTYDNYTQTKIFTIYNTQILKGEKSGTTPIPKYKLFSDTVNQFYNWYVPKSYIDEQTGSTVTGYIKFSFYSAKFGDITLFFNNDNGGLKTPERMYFKVLLNLNTMTWKFDYSSTNFPPNAKAFQVPFTTTYSQRVNDTVESFENEQQNPPDGNVFDWTDGKYDVV